MVPVPPELPPLPIRTTRLQPADEALARTLFLLLAEVFENDAVPLSAPYLQRLLTRPDFWAIAAFTLPRITSESSEVFLYDIAVPPEFQRQSVGRQLVNHLRQAAAAEGIESIFVPAGNEVQHALDFYHALGEIAAPVTIFTL